MPRNATPVHIKSPVKTNTRIATMPAGKRNQKTFAIKTMRRMPITKRASRINQSIMKFHQLNNYHGKNLRFSMVLDVGFLKRKIMLLLRLTWFVLFFDFLIIFGSFIKEDVWRCECVRYLVEVRKFWVYLIEKRI